jgi:C-terminal processing protease CtpA/Prc
VHVEDLADTHQFNGAPTLTPAHAGPNDAGPEYYLSAATSYPLAQGSAALYQTGSLIKKFFRNLLRHKVGWLVILLVLSIATISGLFIARDYVRSQRQQRYENAREMERMRTARQKRQREQAFRSVEEAVQNGMGFLPTSLFEGEYPGIQGVLVARLTSDFSPAALARFQAGDVLTELNGKPVPSHTELGQVLESIKPWSEVGARLYRDGETVATTIRIADRTVPPLDVKRPSREQGFLGLGNVTRRCCIPGTNRWGLEVRRIIDNSPADLAGIQLGDLVTEFNGQPTLTPDEFARRINATAPRSKIKIKFYRAGKPQELELVLGHGWD